MMTTEQWLAREERHKTTFGPRMRALVTGLSTTRLAWAQRLGWVQGPTKVGRNAHCTCGSGRKYKKCCGG